MEKDTSSAWCSRNLCIRLGRLDPVVWMIVIGDGVHNFMDGLSIGAGFVNDLRLGLSVALAVLCEELPHELGDIAILLQSGMSTSLAVLFNFGSACTAYLGFFLGVFLGELPQSAMYIFAITSGFFLYISLADMAVLTPRYSVPLSVHRVTVSTTRNAQNRGASPGIKSKYFDSICGSLCWTGIRIRLYFDRNICKQVYCDLTTQPSSV
ncbi:uncharacterized protein DEA37_0011775 [Paragonimus westermani]|uniref:Uncharacterized protein n=1 Tax=Paragonimus westermani TaxID=34504 RepID=A0A5J4NI65_9TREM|nr:uncharacterized protein DEA37_0011775 [Paragonimus westermani]